MALEFFSFYMDMSLLVKPFVGAISFLHFYVMTDDVDIYIQDRTFQLARLQELSSPTCR